MALKLHQIHSKEWFLFAFSQLTPTQAFVYMDDLIVVGYSATKFFSQHNIYWINYITLISYKPAIIVYEFNDDYLTSSLLFGLFMLKGIIFALHGPIYTPFILTT